MNIELLFHTIARVVTDSRYSSTIPRVIQARSGGGGGLIRLCSVLLSASLGVMCDV